MNSNIDNLIVPHIDNLGEMSTDGIINALEDNGVRRTIDLKIPNRSAKL
ncbi:hypothetical protein [uncultured Muribaculum sp.]|nr:hypothetical protein [uncultured Muribaculum sp.]